MFLVNDEVECINDDPEEVHFIDLHTQIVWPLKKGDTFIVRGIWPAETRNGHWYLTEPAISIGRANTSWQELVKFYGAVPPATYDCWGALRFRKLERKSIYTMLGISETLRPKVPELLDV